RSSATPASPPTATTQYTHASPFTPPHQPRVSHTPSRPSSAATPARLSSSAVPWSQSSSVPPLRHSYAAAPIPSLSHASPVLTTAGTANSTAIIPVSAPKFQTNQSPKLSMDTDLSTTYAPTFKQRLD